MENSYYSADQTPNLLDDIDYSPYYASGGKRFANWLIDLVAFYVFLFVLAMVFTMIAPNFMRDLVAEEQTGFQLQIYSLLIYIVFMWVLETVTKGKTLGKLITGTRAVNLDGTRITARTALLRTLSRLVPFEIFSALGSPCNPWHDRWCNTNVVDERLSRFPGQIQ